MEGVHEFWKEFRIDALTGTQEPRPSASAEGELGFQSRLPGVLHRFCDLRLSGRWRSCTARTFVEERVRCYRLLEREILDS